MKNQEYWTLRGKQLEASLHRDAEKVVADLESMYREAERQIEGDISRWYQRFASNNGIVDMAEARRLLNSNELKEFKWTLKEYREHAKANVDGYWNKELENASSRWHISRLEALKYQLQNTVEVLAGGQSDLMNSLLKDTYLNGYGQTAFTIQSGLRLGWDIAGLSDRTIQTLLNKPWSLDGKNFSERIWENKQALINELHKQLTQNMMRGGNLNDVISSIEKKFNTSRSNAARLVYTEHAYAVSVSSGESYKATGVKQVVFIATLDERTSDICQQMDGSVIDMKDYQPGITVPPLHPWCRSTTSPYYADMAGIGERLAKDAEGNIFTVPREMKYPEWKQTFMKDPETGEAGSKEGLTPVVNIGVGRNYESTIAKKFGKESYDKCMDILNGCGSEDAKAVWKAYESDIGVADTTLNGRQHCDWTASIHVNLKNDLKGDSIDKPGQTIFHECGHAIDMIASRRMGFDTSSGTYHSPNDIYSLRYKNGLFPKTIREEVDALVSAKHAEMKVGFKEHKSDIDWLYKNGYISQWNYDFYKQYGTWVGGEPSYSKSMAYDAIEREVRQLSSYQKYDLLDILEGATKGKMGQGHGKTYFTNNVWALPTEAFAEMYDSTVCNQESLDTIKQYLPKSYEVFTDMMKELVNGVK